MRSMGMVGLGCGVFVMLVSSLVGVRLVGVVGLGCCWVGYLVLLEVDTTCAMSTICMPISITRYASCMSVLLCCGFIMSSYDVN